MSEPKLSRKWHILGYCEAPHIMDSVVSHIIHEDGYDSLSVADVGSCVCDIVKNAIKWGNGNSRNETFDLELNLYDDKVEVAVIDRGKKPFDIRDPISEYPVDGTPDELLEYFAANQKIGRDGVALFMHSKVMDSLESHPVMDGSVQVGTRVQFVYRRK